MHTLIPNKEAVRAGDLIFFGGVLSWDEDGTLKYPYNVEQQTEGILRRIEGYLKTEALGLEHLVYVTVYLTDIRHYDAMNKAYRRIMKDPLPPRKVVTGPLTVTGALVEMTAVASVHPRRVLMLTGS
jgi:enamine deaminase RidA (YjgF/YER057c/UK114 family)